MLAAPAATIDFGDSLNTFLQELKDIGTVEAGVASVGEAAAYALVWEFGNVRQTQKGPKTTLGLNLATGEQVWLSIQAPTGYIRVNEEKYWQIIKRHLSELSLSGTTSDEIREELEEAAHEMAKEIAEVIREAAPEDSGALKASILAISPGSHLLSEDDEGAALSIEVL